MDEFYTFKKIDSPELLQAAYRLRFQVYCRERHFISESDYPEGYETDFYDQYAIHFGAIDPLGQMVGSVRLILPICEQFPVERLSPALNIDPQVVRHQECAEISRLSISKIYRPKDSSGSRASLPDEKATVLMRRFSFISLGLCQVMYEECRQLGIHFCFALMEKPLWMLLKLQGFAFTAIGPELDFYGKVIPYLTDVLENERKGLSHNHSGFLQPYPARTALN